MSIIAAMTWRIMRTRNTPLVILETNMFNRIDYHALVICKNNIRVFAHKLHNQKLAAQVAHFVKVFKLKADYSLKAGLSDGYNLCV